MIQWINIMRHQGEDDVSQHTSSEEMHTPTDADSSSSRCNPNTSSRSCTSSESHGNIWLPKFKTWLPVYLDGVYKRLKDGEVYPLSALKGDFRANCGLDMDHSSLGYSKLSEFIKSVPELCRMKIATVGNGPATHSVLLPAAAHRRTTASNQVQQSSVTSTLVRRIYGRHMKGPISPIERPATLMVMESLSASQNEYRDQHEDIAQVYCVFCCDWHPEINWAGMPYSRFGICTPCKCEAGAYDSWKRNHINMALLRGEKFSLGSEQPVDTFAFISQKLVADKLPVISQELVADNFRLFTNLNEIQCANVHRLN